MLELVRATIQSVAPSAIEVMSYQMPAYRHPGTAYRRPFVWFALRRGYIGLYLRPPTIQDHRRALAQYTTTKSAVHLPLDEPTPTRLVRTLVRAAARAVPSTPGR